MKKISLIIILFTVAVNYSFAQFEQGNCAVYLTSNPSGADIYIDGISADKKTPGMISGLSAGMHKIYMEWGDYVAEKEMALEEGVLTRHEMNLKLKPVKISVNSTPDSALVIMNSREIGRTPVETSLENTGSAAFRFQYNGYIPLDTLVYFAERANYDLNIELFPAGYLKVTSVPEGADVFLDNKFIGRSPLEVQVEAGNRSLQLMTGDYDIYSREISVGHDEVTEITAELQKMTGKLTIAGLIDGSSIFLNDKYIGKTPITGLDVEVGEYSLRYLSQGVEPQNKDYSVIIVQNSDEVVEIKAVMKTAAGAMWRSMIVPGWGQRYEGRENISYIYLAGETALITAAAASLAMYNQAEDNYQVARDEYLIQVENDEITRTWENTESRYDEVKMYARYRNGFIAAAVGFWLWNAADAYIWHTPPTSNPAPLQGKMETQGGKLKFKLTWDF
ncbi:MAG: PEGA domain-containing protein [FCB group bacterium]|nr:PEGA domain-containing protein [FCB group bacterium]